MPWGFNDGDKSGARPPRPRRGEGGDAASLSNPCVWDETDPCNNLDGVVDGVVDGGAPPPSHLPRFDHRLRVVCCCLAGQLAGKATKATKADAIHYSASRPRQDEWPARGRPEEAAPLLGERRRGDAALGRPARVLCPLGRQLGLPHERRDAVGAADRVEPGPRTASR